jgi:trafficking protein particle complex subunit 9
MLFTFYCSTSGVQLETEPIRVVIPANSLHQVILSGKAVQSGTLVIRGCFVIAPGGMSREYILPLYRVEEEQRLARKRRSIISESGRSKYVGLDRYLWTVEQKRRSTHSKELAPGPSFRFLECKVVPEQPLLRIRRTSVTHGGLMLYDGEKCVGLERYLSWPYAYNNPTDP